LRRVPAGRPGAIDISGAAAAADATRAVLAAARDVGIPVVYVKMEHAPDLSDVGPREGPHWIKHVPLRAGDSVVAPDGSEGRILVRDTWKHRVPRRTGARAWRPDRLEAPLQRVLRDGAGRRPPQSRCEVEPTVRDAMFRDYSCVVLEDCTAEPIGDGANHAASLRVIETLFVWVSDARAVCEALAAQAQLV